MALCPRSTIFQVTCGLRRCTRAFYPPWQRERAPKARAPPQPLEFDDARAPSEPECIDPPVDDELYFVDPPAGDDWLG